MSNNDELLVRLEKMYVGTSHENAIFGDAATAIRAAEHMLAVWADDYKQLSEMHRTLGRDRERDLETAEAKRREDVRKCAEIMRYKKECSERETQFAAAMMWEMAEREIRAAFPDDFKEQEHEINRS
jgi:hypothetical protein